MYAVCPDLAKFATFGKIVIVLLRFLRINLIFVILLNIFCQILCSIGQFFIGVNGEELKNNLVIWSHCVYVSESIHWAGRIYM